jgi:hypothetical protein
MNLEGESCALMAAWRGEGNFCSGSCRSFWLVGGCGGNRLLSLTLPVRRDRATMVEGKSETLAE